MFIAKDFHDFKTLFIDGLKNMLADDQLGAFILVLANCLQGEALKQSLMQDLLKNFKTLKNRYHQGSLEATQDDLDVFEKLLAMEIASLPVWQQHMLGKWRPVINVMRRLRPARASAEILSSIYRPFDESGFHFNKPFLEPEIMWEGEYGSKNVRVLYNKFPFVKYHLIIVISPELNQPQIIDRAMHKYVFKLAQDYSDILPGFGVGYNSIAAGASVNHQHFQGFVDTQPLPIEDPGNVLWQDLSYSSQSDDEAWQFISQCLERDIAFNVLYHGRTCYILPRAYQGAVGVPDYLRGAGWSDLSGLLTIPDLRMIDNIDEAQLDAAAKSLYKSVT